jgi:hypothetical protein
MLLRQLVSHPRLMRRYFRARIAELQRIRICRTARGAGLAGARSHGTLPYSVYAALGLLFAAQYVRWSATTTPSRAITQMNAGRLNVSHHALHRNGKRKAHTWQVDDGLTAVWGLCWSAHCRYNVMCAWPVAGVGGVPAPLRRRVPSRYSRRSQQSQRSALDAPPR